jgi:alpha-glucosidase
VLGLFSVAWTPEKGGSLTVHHQEAPGRIVWATLPGVAFAAAGQGSEKVAESRGSFDIRDALEHVCANQTITGVTFSDNKVTVQGMLADAAGRDCVGYTFSLEVMGDRQLAFDLSLADSGYNRAWLTYASEPDEHFFGFGEQFSCFDLKGKRVPIFVQEQGIGRGLQPLTFLINLVAGAGGRWDTSYACVPQYITSKLCSLFLENSEYAVFDLREADRVQVQAFASRLHGRILQGDSPAQLIEEYTSCVGRMRPLPDWLMDGAVVGMQGGTEKVRKAWAALKERDTPVAAFWLQDWVGPRKTSIGRQLWWNWELDNAQYPGWDALHRDLEADGIRLLTYVNPFLADVAEKAGTRRNLFKEASEKGFLVRNSAGAPCLIPNTSFSAGLLDLTNPAACAWMKEVIRDQVIGAGASGWMADFGEALPYDAKLFSGQSAASFHNEYPQAWARLNREAVDATGYGQDFVFFTRSAYRSSPKYTTLCWLGDQLVTWDAHDGIKTAVTGLLSSGMSGFSFNHSDIGGYTTFSAPFFRFRRSKELLLRWMELNAFTVVYRTHEGNQPDANAQFYSDGDTLAQFSRFARVYKAWEFYRKELVQEAARTGLPVVRHPFIHYPEDPNTFALGFEEFLVGSDLLVVPVLDPGKNAVEAYFPAGKWVHVWSGKTFGDPNKGVREKVEAPIGKPAVFYRAQSTTGPIFLEKLRELKVLE